MACKVVRNSDNQVVTVYKKDGTPSQLYNKIKKFVTNPTVAYGTYLKIVSNSQSGIEPTFTESFAFIQDATKNPSKYSKIVQEFEFEFAEEELTTHLKDFLNDIGWRYEWLDEIKDSKTGKPLNVKGKAILSKKLIQLVKGKANASTLTEETAHALVEALRATESSLYNTMYAGIEGYSIYKQIAEPGSFYYEQYEGNTDLLKREAIAKVITSHILKQNPGKIENAQEENPEKVSRLQRWWIRVMQWVKKLFGNSLADPYIIGAELLMESSLEQYLQKEGVLKGKLADQVFPEDELYQESDPQQEILKKLDDIDTYKTEEFIVKPGSPNYKYWKKVLGLKKDEEGVIERYVNTRTGETLTVRLSDAASIMFKKRNFKRLIKLDSVEAARIEAINEHRMASGTMGHKAIERIVNRLTKKSTESLESIKRGTNFNTEQFNLIVKNVKALISHANKIQTRINKENNTKGKMSIRSEQFLLNESQSSGGTIDLLIVFSDGSALIYDWKFKEPKLKKGEAWMVRKGPNKGKIILKKDPWEDSIDQYDSQIGLYTQVLKEQYGIKTIRESRIIPIAIKYEYHKEGHPKAGLPTGTVLDVQMGGPFLNINPDQEGSAFLDPIPVAGELTTISDIDKLITQEVRRYKYLKEMHKNIPSSNREAIELSDARIKASKNIIRRLRLNYNISTALVESARLMKRAERGLGVKEERFENGKINPNYMSPEELLDVYNDLKHFEAYLSVPTLLKELGKDKSEVGKKRLEYLRDKMRESSDIKNTIAALQAEIVLRAINFSNEQGVEGDVLSTFNKKVDTTTKYMVSLSQHSNPYMRTLWKVVRNVNNQMIKISKDVAQEIEGLEIALKEASDKTGQNIYDDLINPETMNLHPKFSTDFYLRRTEGLENRDVSIMKELYEIDPEQYEKFQKRKEGAFKAIENSRNSDVVKRREKEAWEKRWDVKKHDEAWLNYKNAQYGGFLRMKKSTEEKYKSEAYRKIEATPALLNFYEYHRKMTSMVGQIYGQDLGAGFIANIHKDIIESWIHNGAKLSEMTNAALDLLQVRQHDLGFGVQDLKGNFIRRVPRLFTREVTDKNDNIDRTLKSRDLGKSLYLLMMAAHQYKYYTEILPQISLLETMLQDNFWQAEQIQEDQFGKIVKDSAENTAKTAENTNADTFTKFVNTYIYGRSISHGDMVGKNLISANKTVMGLKQFHSITHLGLSPMVAGGALGAGIVGMHVQATKGIHYTHKQLRTAEKMYLTRDPKLRAILEFFEISLEDLMTRRGDLLSATFRGKYMNSDRWFELLARADRTIDAVIATAMAQNHGVHPETGELMRLKELPKGTKSILESIELEENPKWKRGSTHDRYIVTLPGFQEQKVKGTKEEKANLLEKNRKALNAYGTFKDRVRVMGGKVKGTMDQNDKVLFNTHIVGKLFLHYRSWLPALAFERFGRLRYDYIMDHFDQGTWRALFSNIGKGKTFDDVEQALATEVTFLEHTAEVAKDLVQIGIDIGTFGWTNLSAPKENLARAAFEEFLFNQQGNPKFDKLKKGTQEYESMYNKFLESKQANIRGALAELRAILLLTLTIMGLAADWDEDGEIDMRQSWAGRKLYALLNRTYREVAFFWDPTELTGPRASGIPLTSFASLLIKWADNTRDEFFDDVFGENALTTDRNERWHYTFQGIPGLSALSKFAETFDHHKNDKYN